MVRVVKKKDKEPEGEKEKSEGGFDFGNLFKRDAKILDEKPVDWEDDARLYAEMETPVLGHHKLLEGRKNDELDDETDFEEEAKEIFSVVAEDEETKQGLKEIADLAYKGSFMRAKSKINELREKGKIDSDDVRELKDQVKRSKKKLLKDRRAEEILSQKAKEVFESDAAKQSFDLSEKDLKKILKEISADYSRKEGRIHEEIRRIGEMEGTEEDRRAYHFTNRKVFSGQGTEGPGGLLPDTIKEKRAELEEQGYDFEGFSEQEAV